MTTRLSVMIAVPLCAALAHADRAPAGHPAPGRVERIEHRDPTIPPTRGPTTAPVTIELFFVPNTNAAARLPAYRQLERLQADHPTRIRLVYRVVKRNAQVLLPTAALEAHAEGKFFEFMDALNAQRGGTLGREQVLELARGVGLDPQRLAQAIRDDRYGEVLDGNERRFDRLHGGGIPNALFNDKPPRISLGALSPRDLEREYVDAAERALELVDRGVDPRALGAALDAQAMTTTQPIVISIDIRDPNGEDPTATSSDHALASPPLDVSAMPSFGKPGVDATVPVAVLCRPNDTACANLVNTARKVQQTYPDEVRVVWAPFFDVTRDDAVELTLLSDAALCAETVGFSPEVLAMSPGWQWVNKMYVYSIRSHGRRLSADHAIDAVARELEIDAGQLSACRARIATTTLDWIAAARHSGVTRSPAIVIGGRIYEGLTDGTLIQQLVEAELAPGILGGAPPASGK